MKLPRRHRSIPSLDTTSTADISFILLIFFLVVTSFHDYKGVEKNVAADTQDAAADKTQLKQRNVLQLSLTAEGGILLGELPIDPQTLEHTAANFIENPDNLPSLPEKSEKYVPGIGKASSTYNHQIIIDISPQAAYDTYFFVYNTLHNAYLALRDKAAQRYYHAPYRQLNAAQQQHIRTVYPLHITEKMAAEPIASAS